MFLINGDEDILLRTSNNRAILFNASLISEKAARDTLGVQAVSLKVRASVSDAYIADENMIAEAAKFRVNSIPAAGMLAKNLTDYNQLTL